MPRRYLSVNLSEEQQLFIKLLGEYEIDIFSIDTIESQIQKQFKNLNEVIENLVDKDFISRIERGKYCQANFRDELVIGTFISKESAVAYWTALNRHGLTEQFSNTIFIQTTHLKKDKTIFGVPYKFIQVTPSKKAGIIMEGYGNRIYSITDVEKTIVDCFDLPQYSGGYAELLRAVGQARLKGNKMIQYCKAINNIAAIKRIGYLVELLDKKGMRSFIRYAKQQVNPKYNLFDPQGLETGEFISKWKLRMNLPEGKILEITNQQY